MDTIKLYASALGGLLAIFMFIHFLPHLAMLIHNVSIVTSKHLVPPYLVHRHRIFGPWGWAGVIVQLIYVAVNLFCICFRASTIANRSDLSGPARAFGPEGIPELRILAWGDFSHDGRWGESNVPLCRDQSLEPTRTSFQTLRDSDFDYRDLIDENMDTLSACSPDCERLHSDQLKNAGSRLTMKKCVKNKNVL